MTFGAPIVGVALASGAAAAQAAAHPADPNADRSVALGAAGLLWAAIELGPAAPDRTESIPLRWTDGIYDYDGIWPVEGYLAVEDRTHRIPGKEFLGAMRRMTAEELREYATGEGGLKNVRYSAAFGYKASEGLHVFLWEGRQIGQQQILLGVWDGTMWRGGGWGTGRADQCEHLLYHPSDGEICYVRVSQQMGTRDQDHILTRRVSFARFPGVEEVIRRGLETAHTVVFVPRRGNYRTVSFRSEYARREIIDCLRGHISGKTFSRVPGAAAVPYDSMVFLEEEAGRLRIRFTLDYGSSFRNRFGDEVRLETYGDTGDAERRAKAVPGHIRWRIARQAARAESGSYVTLALTDPHADTNGWFILELAVGKEGPGTLFRPPVTREGSDGGQALFSFTVRDGQKSATLGTRWSFGFHHSSDRSPTLHFEYRFVYCGPGVVKLALRPTRRPWKAEVVASYWHLDSPYERSTGPYTTPPIILRQD